MRNFTRFLAAFVSICFIFSLAGCSFITGKLKKAAEDKISDQLTEEETEEETTEAEKETEETEEATEDDDNGDTTAITTSNSKDMDWPGEYMENIPEIDAKIVGVYTAEGGSSVSFEGLARSDADAYVEKLEDLGYTNGYAGEDDSGLSFVKSDEDGNSVWFFYAPDGTGEVMYTAAET